MKANFYLALVLLVWVQSSAGQQGNDVPGSSGNPDVSGSGSQSFVPLWLDNNGALGNSILFQKGSGASAKVGLNLKNPLATLDVNGTTLIRGILEPVTKGFATAD